MPDTISCAVAESKLHTLIMHSTYKKMMQLLYGLDDEDFNFVHHGTAQNHMMIIFKLKTASRQR